MDTNNNQANGIQTAVNNEEKAFKTQYRHSRTAFEVVCEELAEFEFFTNSKGHGYFICGALKGYVAKSIHENRAQVTDDNLDKFQVVEIQQVEGGEWVPTFCKLGEKPAPEFVVGAELAAEKKAAKEQA
jgi:hypothetical protein